jgi:hypothetical protein
MVGVTIENVYPLTINLGAGFFHAIGTGVLVNVGVTFYQATGPNYAVSLAGFTIYRPGAPVWEGTGCWYRHGRARERGRHLLSGHRAQLRGEARRFHFLSAWRTGLGGCRVLVSAPACSSRWASPSIGHRTQLRGEPRRLYRRSVNTVYEDDALTPRFFLYDQLTAESGLRISSDMCDRPSSPSVTLPGLCLEQACLGGSIFVGSGSTQLHGVPSSFYGTNVGYDGDGGFWCAPPRLDSGGHHGGHHITHKRIPRSGGLVGVV